MTVACGYVHEAYQKAVRSWDADDWRMYIALSDVHNAYRGW